LNNTQVSVKIDKNSLHDDHTEQEDKGGAGREYSRKLKYWERFAEGSRP
jgi:hypothetical protein